MITVAGIHQPSPLLRAPRAPPRRRPARRRRSRRRRRPRRPRRPRPARCCGSSSAAPVSSAPITTRVGASAPHFAQRLRRPAWSRASSKAEASRTATLPRSAWTRERGAHRLAARLAVDLDRVVARLRAEGDAAAVAVRHAERAGAGAAGALLAPGLGGGHRDLAAGQGRGGAPAARGEVGAGRLVDERLVEGLGEELFRQVGLGRSCRGRRALALAIGCLTSTHRVLAPRDRAPDQQQVALGVDLGDFEARAG